jgi:hypothetical protein
MARTFFMFSSARFRLLPNYCSENRRALRKGIERSKISGEVFFAEGCATRNRQLATRPGGNFTGLGPFLP